jgi:hypothetical protein
MLCVAATQGRDARTHGTVYNATLRQRRHGVSCYNQPLLTRTAQLETKGPTSWTFYNGGADGETQLPIETSSDNTLT